MNLIGLDGDFVYEEGGRFINAKEEGWKFSRDHKIASVDFHKTIYHFS